MFRLLLPPFSLLKYTYKTAGKYIFPHKIILCEIKQTRTILGFRMQWQVPEYEKKTTTLIQAMQMYTKLVENVPDFCSNIKDSSSSNTFLQIHKKVRNELLCLLVA